MERFLSLIDEPLTDLGVVYCLGCCRAEALPRSFHHHQVRISRHFAAVTSGLDFIFSRVQNPSNKFGGPSAYAVSACAPMGVDFGKEINNWPTSVSAASLWLTCSHAMTVCGLSPDAK